MWKIEQPCLTLLLKIIFVAVFSSQDGLTVDIVCQVCSCIETWAGEFVNCTNRNLSTVPQGFPHTSDRLYLDKNSLTRISGGDFWTLKNLTSMKLAENKIRYLESGSFEHLSSLEFLDLGYNQIRYLKPTNFQDLAKLRTLHLEYNNITSISDSCFKTLIGLKNLDLKGNRLKNISSETFRGLKKLRYLYLEDNNIRFVEPGVFQDLGSLTALHLERNNISELANGTFRGLNALTKLYLTDNRIRHIAPWAFMDVKTLNSLFLDGNNISEINNYTLEGLQYKTMEISLENNCIKTLAPGTFDIFGKSRLFRYLSIAGNKLETLENKTFSGLRYLIDLHLENNNIQVIDVTAFYRMTSIITIKLNGNRLRNITNGTFYYRRTLRTLILSDNNISSLPDGVFARLKSLRTLNLTNNPLQYIHTGHFRGLSRLQNLQMEFCGIKQIGPKSFASSKALDTLNLARNSLTRINTTLLRDLRYLYNLYLQNNEIQVIENNSFASNNYITHLFLHGNKLSKIPIGVLDPLWRCNFLALSNNNITEIEPEAFHGLKKIHTIFLQYNRLELIKKEDFAHLRDLEKLYLFDNKISSIEIGSFPHQHLAQLLLYKNAALSSINIMGDSKGIHKPNVTVYMYPENLPSIAVDNSRYAKVLHRNGFQCECQFKCNCKMCPRGTYSRGDGVSIGCLVCPAGGFYQDSVAAVGVTAEGHGCQHCPNGTFVHPNNAPGKASWECKACPEGTNTTTLAGFRACSCLRNHFRLDRFGPCTVCPGHGVECSKDTLHLSRGFYWSWMGNESKSDNKKAYKLLIKNLAIESDSYNKETMKFVGKVPKAYKCVRQSSCLGGIDSECAEGYAGPLCANCQSGFYKRMIACHKCPSKKLIAIQFGVLALTILLIILVILKSDRSSKPGRRTVADIFLAHVKIVIGFYQVLAGLLQAFSYVKWPSEVSILESYIRFVQLNVLQIVSPSCVEESFKVTAYGNFLFTMAGNVLIVAVPMLWYLARVTLMKIQRKEHDKRKITNFRKPCLKITMFLLFVAYPSTCVNIFNILPLSCHELCPFDGASNCPSFLRADYSILCDTATHRKYSWAAYASLTYVVGFPIFLAYIVWKTHRQSQRSNKFSISDERNNMEAMAFAILFLHENYSPSCWYWESMEMARKVILSAGVIFVGAESRTQIGIAAMVSAGFAMLHGRFRPITDRFEDYLQMTSLLATSFNLGIGVLLKVPSDESTGSVNKSHDNVGLGILLLVTNALVITVVLARYLVVFSRLAVDFRNNPRFSWSCLFLLMTTAQEVQGEANDDNLQRASTQTVVVGSGNEMPSAAAVFDECFDVSFESNIDEQMRPSVKRMESLTVNT
ncbi:uncharacterized protein LOC144649736 isoform X1 [Oculina patagonica]